MNNTIDMAFIRLMVEKKDFYYISLVNVFSWFGEPYSFREYITNTEYKREFDAKYLGDNNLMEAGSNGDFEADYILRTLYNVSFPWFSSNGFKSLCVMFGTSKTQYIKNVFNLVENTYLHVIANDDSDMSIEMGSNHLMNRIKGLFIRTMILYNNKPIR